MKTIRIIFNMIYTDLLSRLRSYSFLIILAATILLAYLSIPPVSANYMVLGLGNIRGIYNSAWIGNMTAIITSTMLSLPSFYLINAAIKKDSLTGVGQIIATTPVSKPLYIFGKILGNFFFLTVMILAIAISACVMQIIRAEEITINLWQLLSPFLFITLPTMLLVSCLAVFFESVSWLNGTFGNILYFFLWMSLFLMYPLISIGRNAIFEPLKEITGMTIALSGMSKAAAAVFPDYVGGSGLILFNTIPRMFYWEGIDWTFKIILSRLIWVGVAIAIGFIASVIFIRFDPALEKRKLSKASLNLDSNDIVKKETSSLISGFHFTPLSPKSLKFSISRMLTVELRLMLKGLGWWWYAIAIGFIISGTIVPTNILLRWLLPITWIWPIAIWSKMGSREFLHRTNQYVFAAAYPLRRQLPFIFLSGVIITAVTGIGSAINFGISGEFIYLLNWIVAVLFIPSLALVSGILSNGRKLFEVIYLILWYLGPISRVKYFDFLGSTKGSSFAGIPILYLITTLILIGISFICRLKQLKV